jgi:hypothetical protein
MNQNHKTKLQKERIKFNTLKYVGLFFIELKKDFMIRTGIKECKTRIRVLCPHKVCTYHPSHNRLGPSALSRICKQYHGRQFYWWRKPDILEKTTDLPQVSENFIISCCIEYTSLWAWFELTNLVVICTDCTCSCKSKLTYDHDHHGPSYFVYYIMYNCIVGFKYNAIISSHKNVLISITSK